MPASAGPAIIPTLPRSMDSLAAAGISSRSTRRGVSASRDGGVQEGEVGMGTEGGQVQAADTTTSYRTSVSGLSKKLQTSPRSGIPSRAAAGGPGGRDASAPQLNDELTVPAEGA